MSIGQRKLIHIVGALVLTSALSACATTGLGLGGGGLTKGYPKVSNTVLQACAAGGSVGLAKVFIEDVLQGKRRRAHDYLIEGAVGTVVGCTAGAVVNNKREKFAKVSEYYASEIESTKKLNAQLKSVNAHLFTRTKANNEALKSLRAQKKAASIDAEAARQARNTAKADFAWASEQLESAKASLEVQETVLSESGTDLKGPDKASLQNEIKQLQNYVDTLEKEVGYMSNINDALVNV